MNKLLHKIIVYSSNDYMTNQPSPNTHVVSHPGPPLMAPAVSYAILALAGVFSGILLAPRGVPFPLPYQPVDRAVEYVSQAGRALRWGSFFQLGSAVPLGIFAAVVVSRLRFLGVRAAGVMIALCGGIGAMVLLMVSALAAWALGMPGTAQSAGGVRALQLLGFAAGGPGFVVPFGLLVAGVSITGGVYRLIPRWLMWLGIVVAVCSELAIFTLVTWKASIFIPVGRFIGIVWMLGIAATLTRTKTERAA